MTTAPGSSAPPSAVPSWHDFNQLTKTSISAASTFTAAAGYLAALRGFRWGLLTALLGILMLAMGSCALNELQELKHDARMERTRNRPLPSGRVSPLGGLLLGAGLSGAGFALLLWRHGWPSALLGVLALVWYNGVYTPLKRVTAFAIIPGALIGAIPPAIGWAAAGGALNSPAMLSLCLLFFLWQVPHFWMLMLIHDQDYGRAEFPTLSRHFRADQSGRLSFTWMAATAFSCAFLPVFGAVFSFPVMIILGVASLWLLWQATALLHEKLDRAVFRRTFWCINLFALVMILAVIADPFLPAPTARISAIAQGHR
jgi:heme o synthase